ncbi:MAG TPA: hypothetical protein VNN25_17340 [Thermoanaerobaculia bacterium]|nr:hypothetical protein [Thermoanaerobaculia bacterium]
MNARTRACFLAVLILCAFRVFADEPAIIKPMFGLNYTLGPVRNSSGWMAARIPITIEKDAKKTIAIETTYVTTTASVNASWAQCVRTGFSRPPGTTLAILITSTCANLGPATYEVNVAVTSEKQVQRLVFQITRPVGELRPLTTQIVDRTDSIACIEIAPKELIVVETGARTPLTNVSASRIENLAIDGKAIDGDLKFGNANADSRGVARLPVTLSGHFPNGVAKTTVMIRANELAAPVFVTYEIHARFHPWLLFLAILIGLLLGYAMRTLLVRFVESRTAYIAALDLRDKIDSEKKKYSDPTFIGIVDPLLTRLRDAIDKRPVDLTAIVNDIKEKYNAAVSTLQDKIKAVRAAFDASVSLLSPDDFPPDIAKALTEAQQTIDEARKLVDSDPTGAQNELTQATANLQADVDSAAAGWRVEMQVALADAVRSPLPPNFDEPFRSALATLKTGLEQLPIGQSKDTVTILSAVHGLQFTLRFNLVKRVLDPMQTYGQSVIDVLKQKSEPVAGSEAALQAFAAANGPAPLAQLDALLSALAADIKAAGDKNGVNVQNDLAAGKYLEAARAAVKQPPIAAIGSLPGTLATPLAAAGEAFPVSGLQFVQRAFPHAQLALPDTDTIERQRSVWEIAAAKLARFAISALGISMAGLLVLLPAFDGTWRGLLTGLFWGYAGDISVDALTEAAKKYRT